MENLSLGERLRLCFEQLGPTFVKLGQLLATRPDLIPQDVADELKKLHDQVATLPFSQIRTVLESHFGTDLNEVFLSFDEDPLAAASIAQVHRAVLKDGSKVVVKIQRPGIQDIIAEDLSVMYTLAELLDKYIPEARLYQVSSIVNEFFKALDQETNFVIEANNIRRFHKNFINEPNIKIPEVYMEQTGRKVLVLEELQGIPLSHKNALEQEGINREAILKVGLRCYLKMVFTDGLFHGDLHAGNLLVLPNNQIGLIDFGVVGRLNKKTQAAIANMLLALFSEDYERLAYEYVDLAPYSGHVDADRFARDLRDLIAPYHGLTFKNVNAGRLLLDSTGIAARHGLQLPTELVLFFKSIVAIEGMGRIVVRDFDFLSYSLEFADEIVRGRLETTRVIRELTNTAKDLSSVAGGFPRHLKQYLRKINSPSYAIKIELLALEKLRSSVVNSAHTIFLGLVIGGFLISSSIVVIVDRGPRFFEIPILALLGYSFAGILGLVAFYRYLRQ
ncbi:MAG: phosphotransferase [Bdellovibrionaceae bacterium]|nr:phosphotransferase [Bdellovibrionales bacterium]MCB9086414.1 phosphotransferase [Pseudobdellovibrionaceae bacterium]